MSLADFSAVDLVTRLPGKESKAALIIDDDGNVSNNFERETALKKKLSTYLLFVKTGQFKQAYPNLTHCDLVVEVVCSTPPINHMKQIDPIAGDELALPINVGMEDEFQARVGLGELKERLKGQHRR